MSDALKDVKTKTTFKVRFATSNTRVTCPPDGASYVVAFCIFFSRDSSFFWNPSLSPLFKSQGNLDTYRFCDNVWTFLLDDVTFTMTGPGGFKDTAHVEKLKIVACDGKVTGGAPKEVGSAPVEGS